MRWGNRENISCPCCGCKKIYNRKNPKAPYRCSQCKKDFSVRTNSLLAQSNISLKKRLLAIYLLSNSKKGISSVELGEKLGISQTSAWFLAHRIREACLDVKAIGGEVEMDETFIGGKEKNKHLVKKKGYHGTQGKTAVMGAISREDKQVIAYPVKEVSYSTVEGFRDRHIEKGSLLYSDDATCYEGQALFRVKHSKKEYVRDGHIHTNTIESFWAIVKRGYVGVYHQWSKKHLRRYIKEYTYRYNNRGKDVFDIIVQNTNGRYLSYKELVA